MKVQGIDRLTTVCFITITKQNKLMKINQENIHRSNTDILIDSSA